MSFTGNRLSEPLALQLLILGIVIGSNNFATALALGALGQAERQWRILLMFAGFEFAVPLVGLWLGARISGLVADGMHWLGPALIGGLGVMTLWEATRKPCDNQHLARWLTSWRGLISLSAAMSLDNLIIGFSLGLSGVPPLLTASVIMLCSVSFAWVGLQIGARSRRTFESQSEALSGLLLLAVAVADWVGWL